MTKVFYSGTYSVQHQFITEENVKDMLKDDIRTKLVDKIDDVIYASDGVVTKNPNVTYIGGFYYEKGEAETVTEKVVNAELEQIDRADLIVVNLIGHSAIGSVADSPSCIVSSFESGAVRQCGIGDCNGVNHKVSGISSKSVGAN